MNRMITLLAMPLAVFLLGASKPTPEVSVKHDRFKAQTEVRGRMKSDRGLRATSRCDRPGIEWVAILPDVSGSSAPQQFALLTYAMCDGWQYLKCHDVSVLADSVRLDLEVARQDHSGESVYGSTVLETIVVPSDRATFLDIAAATRVDFQQCRTEWLLTSEEKGVLIAFLAKVEEISPAASAPPPAPLSPPPVVTATCTPEQRAAMVKLGLTVDQILAACPN